MAIGGREVSIGVNDLLLVGLNGFVIAVLFGFRRLYKPIERLMMVLVLLMIAGFFGNLVFARISVIDVVGGLLPTLPERAAEGLVPYMGKEGVVDPLWAVTGVIGTTFSVVGAFYQSYLVREKGWQIADVKRGLTDSVAGMTVLGLITMVVMVTSAAVLSGRVRADDLKSVTDVASQLQPLFGPGAKILFGLGIFAGAFSSFLINAMIGGAVLADGVGLNSSMDRIASKLFTTLALLVGMSVALTTEPGGSGYVGVIVFAQAVTVLGNPLLALVMLYFAFRPLRDDVPRIPLWIRGVAVVGGLVAVGFAVRTGWRLWLQLFA